MLSRILTFLMLLISIVFFSCNRMENDQSQTIKSGGTLVKIRKEGVLHVGYIIYPPTVMKDSRIDQLTGHFVDTVEEIARYLGVKVKYYEVTWSTFVAGLQAGEFDLSIAATYRTIPRALEVAFTRPLMYLGNSAIVRKGDNRFQNLEDLDKKGIKIAVTEGEAGHEFARTNLHNPELIVHSTAEQSVAFSRVFTGKADLALGDAWATAQYAATHPEVVDLFAEKPFNLTAIGWAVRPDDLQWLNFINTALDFLESTGKLAEFEKKYGARWLHQEVQYKFY